MTLMTLMTRMVTIITGSLWQEKYPNDDKDDTDE